MSNRHVIRWLGIGLVVWMTLTGCAELTLAAYAVNGLTLLSTGLDAVRSQAPTLPPAVPCCHEVRPEETP